MKTVSIPNSYGSVDSIETRDDDVTLNRGSHGRFIRMISDSPKTVVIPRGLDLGFTVTIMQEGNGLVTFSPASGVSIETPDNSFTTGSKYQVVRIFSQDGNRVILSKSQVNGLTIGGTIQGTTPGSVLFSDSSGNLGEDDTSFSWDDIAKTAKVRSGTYQGAFGAGNQDSTLIIGTADQRVDSSNNYIAVENQQKLNLSGTGKNIWGSFINIDVQGSPDSPVIMGQRTSIFSNGFFPTTTSTIYGHSITIDVSFPAAFAAGAIISAQAGGSGASGMQSIKGIDVRLAPIHNGDAALGIVGDFKLSTANSSPSICDLVVGVKSWAQVLDGNTITEYRAISISDWVSSGTGSIGKSYGIYADASIDKGISEKWFIYSLSTSRSKFSGPIEVPEDGYDETTWDGSLEVPEKNSLRDKFVHLADKKDLFTSFMSPMSMKLDPTSPTGSSILIIPRQNAIPSGIQNIYTCPIGFKALVMEGTIGNFAGAGAVGRTAGKVIGGVFYRFTSGPVNLAIPGITQNFQGTGYRVLNAGESFAFNLTAAGARLHMAWGWLLPATFPIKHLLVDLTAVDQLLYQCPVGKRAQLIPLSTSNPYLLGGTVGIEYVNDSGSNKAFQAHFVPNGESVSSTNLVWDTSGLTTGTLSNLVMPASMQEGDAIYVKTDVASVAGTQFASISVIEFDA